MCDLVKALNYREIHRRRHFPSVKKPEVVGFFSLDTERSYSSDTNQLKYINFPHESLNVRWDLNRKLDKRIQKEEVDEKLDNLLKWIQQYKLPFDRTEADIVCYRGLLTLIMCSPYEKREGWIIKAMKWNGVIYLCEEATEAKKKQIRERTLRDMRFLAWGRKFEQYLSSVKPGEEPDVSQPNNEREEFCAIFKTKLNEHRILYGAEMDGIESLSLVHSVLDFNSAEFVELKTNRLIESDKQDQNFKRYKLIKWWCQSFLVGINKVLCGFRDDDGIVHRVDKMDVSSFPKKGLKFWDPAVCMNFCDYFLTLVKSVVVEDSADTVWKFEWNPDKDILVAKVKGSPEYIFLQKLFANVGKQ